VEEEEVVVLTVVSGEQEAEIVCGLLRSAGLKCGYRDTEAITPMEDFTPSGPREVLVAAADVDEAKSVLAAFEA
jgi:hypothetical protein